MDDHTRGSVLVVDDEPTIAEVVARYLERAGYQTRVAGDGLQAIEAAASQRPDLVVLDLMLPGLDGLAHRAADGIEVEVADSGDGIAPNERDRVFTASTAAAPTRPGRATAPDSD